MRLQRDKLTKFATDGFYLTIRPAARKGYGSIAHEAKPNGLLTVALEGKENLRFDDQSEQVDFLFCAMVFS